MHSKNRIGKAVVQGISACAVYPALMLYRLHAAMVGAPAAFPGWAQLISLLPGKVGVYLRRSFLSSAMNGCGEDACVSFGTLFSDPRASVGRTVYVGNYCSIGNVVLEDDVLIASHVSIMNGSHQHGVERLDIPIRNQIGVYEPVTIGRDTWIGERATVAANVGRSCVIGAGSVVLSPIPDFAVAVGVPARVIRDRRHSCDSTDMLQKSAAETVC